MTKLNCTEQLIDLSGHLEDFCKPPVNGSSQNPFEVVNPNAISTEADK